jgi:hypothetical protein
MRNLIPVIIATVGISFGCNQTSTKGVEEAKENLSEAKTELKDARERENEAIRAKELAEWRYFTDEADSSMANMQNDLQELGVKLEKANAKNKKKLNADYAKAKIEMEILREKLRKRNLEFERDLESFGDNVSEKNQSFKREFRHDVDEFGKSLKDMFSDNVN